MDQAGRDKFHWDDPMREYVMKKQGLDVVLLDDDLGDKHNMTSNTQR